MPDEFTTLQRALRAARAKRAATETQLRTNALRVSELEHTVTDLRRAGADAPIVTAAIAELESARNERGRLIEARRGIESGIHERIGGMLDARTPDQLFTALDARVPLALLPVRLETRFSSDRSTLRVRVFPDQIHLDNHEPRLTDTEAELGRWYWQQRLHDEEAAGGAFEALSGTLGAPRAAWVARALTPQNYDAANNALVDGDEPVFPHAQLRPHESRTPPRAVALPDRWVAVGLRRVSPTRLEPVFTKWGSTVPDALNVGPAFEHLADIPESAEELPIDEEMRWLTDFDAAQRVGMAMTVRQADLRSGAVRDGFDLLLVFGVDWTLTPAQSAESLEALLQAHEYTDGLAFVAQGTPTNNTAARNSGFSSAPAASSADPLKSASAALHSAGARLAGALGLDSASTALNRVSGSQLREQRTTSLLVETLWESTLGYYLDALIDPFATDTMIDLARDHARTHLQPFGPYAALRVGRQPYGVLPTLAYEGFQPDRPKGIEQSLSRLLTVLRWYWRDGLADVPKMGRSNDPDDDLLKLLQQTPVAASARYRRVLDLETATGVKGLESLTQVQSTILRSLVLPTFASYAGPMFNYARILQLAVYPTDRPLTAPWVQPGPLEPGQPLTRNYIAEIAQDVRNGAAGRTSLESRSRSTYSLLEALLAHAALRELDRAGTRVLDRFAVDAGLLDSMPVKSTMHTGSTIGVYQPPEQSVPGKVFLETPKQLASAVVRGLTGDRSVADYVSEQIRLPLGPERPELHTLASFLSELDELATLPAAEIDRSFRAILDCYSHRYDAWATSLASRRMADVRRRRATGLHLGGYGWVENLRPDTAPDSLGYIHTPSLNHATTAALLRSGHLSHRGAEGAALNIDLSSRRVRNALALLEGVAEGQPLAALLGYRFERGLRDRLITLARFILPFRKLAPLRSTVPDASSEPSESIAARDVVDGVALAERSREPAQAEALIDQVATGPLSTRERELLREALADLNDVLDSISDVLTAEAMYQTVQGNHERAGAALAALDRQSRPPDPQFIRTPRSGIMYTQRVGVVVQRTEMPTAWQQLSLDLNARVEPRLNAWIATLLGDPTRYRIAAQVQRGGEVVETLSTGLLELGLSPLTLVLSSGSPQANRPSDLELRVSTSFAQQATDPQPGDELVLSNEPPADHAETIGFGALRAFLKHINTFIAGRRALDARDIYPPEGDAAPGIDIAELERRLDDVVEPALDAAIASLGSAIGAPDANALRAALNMAAGIGSVDALPETLLDDDEAIMQLTEQAERVLAGLQRTAQQLADRRDDFPEPDALDETYASRMAEHLIGCIRLVLGESFPVLPLFTPANADELAASYAQRDALLDGDTLAPLTWLQQVAPVRTEVDKLVSVLTAADLLGNGLAAEQVGVAQLPHIADKRWAALTLPQRETLLACALLGSIDFALPMAGLLCDGWSEMVPAAQEMTGLTFHYDAPAARAPQSILLAVSPDLSQSKWSYDMVLQTLLQTWELMQLRVVGPKEIRALGGGMLPAVYLREDRTFQVPAVDLDRLAIAYRPAGTISALGKLFDAD